MTETGSQLICNYPCMEIKPGSMGKPIPGVEAAIVDNQEMNCLLTEWEISPLKRLAVDDAFDLEQS